MLGAAVFACALQLWTACGKKGEVTPVSRGAALYHAHCTACHAFDPARDGSLGPAIKGSSLELLQARVLRAEYPPGYTPRRTTKVMQKLPMTEDDVKDIHAFLNAAQ